MKVLTPFVRFADIVVVQFASEVWVAGFVLGRRILRLNPEPYTLSTELGTPNPKQLQGLKV